MANYRLMTSMKIVYSDRYALKYSTNPVENPDRVILPAQELQTFGPYIEPEPASLEDISLVHDKGHIQRVMDRGLYDVAAWAAGGAITAARLALSGEPAFALIRPPGHHASWSHAWGMCFFNNMAVAVMKIRNQARRALIIDIDLHFGDGTVSIFRGDRDVKIVNPGAVDLGFDYLDIDQSGYVEQVRLAMQSQDYDIVGISAGFDGYVEDWGGLLRTEDYGVIGRIVREESYRCQGRRFAILEGGYHPHLRYNIKGFLDGFA